MKIDPVLDKLEDYCMPRVNMMYETYRFYSRHQEEGELIDNYLTALKAIAETVSLKTETDGFKIAL